MELTDRPAIHWFSAEMLVAYQFCKQGYAVGVPLSPCEYDLLIDTKQKVWRVQVKKARFEEQRTRPQGLGDRAHWSLMLTKRKRNGNGKPGMYHKRISDDEFDYLVVVCQEDSIYVIPKEQLLSEQEPGKLKRLFHIKPPLETGRLDSIKAGIRWEPYKNNFNLEEVNVKTKKRGSKGASILSPAADGEGGVDAGAGEGRG